MVQLELENSVREMKAQRNAELKPLQELQMEVKEEIASINRQIHALQSSRSKIEQQRIGISEHITKVYEKWNERIAKLREENPVTVRSLEDVSEWAIVRELRARGYGGSLTNGEKPEDFLSVLNANLNGAIRDEIRETAENG